MITKDAILQWLRRLAEVYEASREHLTDLDSYIGDADHGTNMARGFGKVLERMDEFETKSIGGILKDVGMVLVSTVGGSSGPLYGTWFIRAGAAVGTRETLTAESVLELFAAGLDGVIQRGKANLNDKTMVDALSPALDALRQALAQGTPLADALAKASEAAETGMTATIPLQARKGRASYLGERSIGHQDPGATSAYLLVKAAEDCWR